ncbi:hypothetical protein [Ralstonia sp. ASV6]|uniref:hypothetical protein n=1 Tax=Ralstonia sp. ASV6 TaxID=2795124 RepID=UPI0018ECAC3C|nr:hypothetical protein [Ralstonia sp. ASV6]
MDQQSGGLIQFLMNIAGALPAMTTLVTAVFAFYGVYLVGSGIKGFYDLTAYGNYSAGNYQHRTSGGLFWRIFCGVILTMLPLTLGIFGNSVFGSEVSSGPMSYQTAGMSAMQQAAVAAIFQLFALVGYVTFGQGWVSLNATKSGQNQMGVKVPLVFIFSGVLLVYLQQVLNAFAAVTGLNVLNLLLF